MLTTSFGHSIRRNQHCINLRSHLSSAVFSVLNQLQKYDIREIRLSAYVCRDFSVAAQQSYLRSP